MKALIAVLCLSISGCAAIPYCQHHPVVCSTVTAVVVSGAVSAYTMHRVENGVKQELSVALTTEQAQ